jgi:hypothetical protein
MELNQFQTEFGCQADADTFAQLLLMTKISKIDEMELWLNVVNPRLIIFI